MTRLLRYKNIVNETLTVCYTVLNLKVFYSFDPVSSSRVGGLPLPHQHFIGTVTRVPLPSVPSPLTRVPVVVGILSLQNFLLMFRGPSVPLFQ